MTTETDNARNQAKAQLDSIIAMVERLEHSIDWDWTNIDERERYHDEDDAREAIEQDALSVEVRSDWMPVGQATSGNMTMDEYRILLCTGGPAVMIEGNLNHYNEPDTARLMYQDWFTPWQEYVTTGPEDQALITYASQFWFGE